MYRRVNELLGTDFKSDIDIDWGDISSDLVLSESFIREFKDEVTWSCISISQTLSEDFIREFKDKVYWVGISICQNLSETFIKEFKDRVNWNFISTYQVLSEDFIREFKEEVNLKNISSNQILSWEFILEFEDRVDWEEISRYQFLIDDPNYEKIDKKLLLGNELYQLYQETKNRGWFINYVKDIPKNFKPGKTLLFFQSELEYDFTTQARIYWKDVKLISRVDNFELIRKGKFI